MGHLVNAKSFRLGWNQSWSNVWYSNISDYTIFLFICFRLRGMLRMFLYSKQMDKTDFIFSHFDIINIVNI
jgi:hypothetical protein